MPALLVSEAALAALRLSLVTAAVSTVLCILLGGPLAVVLARGTAARAAGCCARSCCCRWCCRRSSAGSRCCSCSGRTGLRRARPRPRGSASPSRSPRPPWSSPRRSSRCRSSSSAWRARCAPPGSATRPSPRPSARRPALAFRRVTVPLVLPGLAVRRGARVRPLHGRVRRDDRVRRQPGGHHPDAAAARLPAARVRRGRRGGAVAAAGRGVRGRDRGRPPARRGGPADEPPALDARRARARAPAVHPRRRARPSAPGEVLAVLGPNGAGKSTLLGGARRAAAPDDRRPTSGSATARVTGAGVHVPPHRRGVGLLAQQALLFPHLTRAGQRRVRPARARACRAATPSARARELLDAVDVGGARRPPAGAALRRPAAAGGAGPRAGRRTPACCCSTSRWPRSTSTPPRPCARCCAG